MLPDLIAGVDALVANARPDDARRFRALQVDVYVAAAKLATKLGANDLAWLTSDRAAAAAQCAVSTSCQRDGDDAATRNAPSRTSRGDPAVEASRATVGGPSMSRVVYVIASAAPPVLRLIDGLEVLTRTGWDPCVILTPTAESWIDVAEVERSTNHPVRVRPRLPHERDPLPKASAVLAAPLTFNTLNKWANGSSDTLALGLLNESIGLNIPVTAAPVIKPTLRKHPAYARSLATLRSTGVDVADPDGTTVRLDDGTVVLDWHRLAERIGSPANQPDE